MTKRDIYQAIDISTLSSSMEDAIVMLRHYGQTRPSARRCLSTLTSILHLQLPSNDQLDMHGIDNSFGVSSPLQTSMQVNDYRIQKAPSQPNMNWSLPSGSEDAMFEFFSDQWLYQPHLDSFNYVGI
jgi:hypothetical protein